MDWCSGDLSCWSYWLNNSAVRWAQVAISAWIAWLALCGPKKEREHQTKNLIEEREYQERKQKEDRQRQLWKEQLRRVEHAIGVLKVLRATAARLKKTGKLIDDWRNNEERETAQLRRIATDLEVDDQACSTISLTELSDHELIDSVLEVSRQTKLLLLAIDDYLIACRPTSGTELVSVSVFERQTAFTNLTTATLYLGLAEVDKKVGIAIDTRQQILVNLRHKIHH